MAAPVFSASGQEWQAAVQDIDHLVQVHTSGVGTEAGGITRSHWVPASKCPKCQGCNAVFSLTERHHHCRRCGGVFCKPCSRYRRRLNVLARPDPNGQLHKVCKTCHEEGPQTVGFSRDWKNTLKFFRSGGTLDDGSIPVVNLCGKLNFTAECERLKKGYTEMIGSGSLMRQLSEIKSMVGIPEWQKAKKYVLDAMKVKCSICEKPFGITRSKVHCSICGTALCTTCSSKDLIVYVPDGVESNTARLAIIKIIGCPEVEPAKCMYLRVCRGCKNRIEEDQVAQYRKQLESTLNPEEVPTDVLSDINTINTKLRKVQEKIDGNLPKYQELVDALDLRPEVPKSPGTPASQSNIQVLAKAQGDMADHFSQFVLVIGDMKQVKPRSRTQAVLIQNVIRAKCQYYQEHMWTFRDLRRRLEEVTPVAVLRSIQDIVDRNAINSCYVSVKQLAYEGLHLVGAHGLGAGGEQVVRAAVQVEAAVERELHAVVARANEDWAVHQACVDELLQVQLKEHRFVRPSRRLIKRYGAAHVQQVLLTRTVAILQQLQLQLTSKTSDSSFPASKDKLQEQEEVLKAIRTQDKDIEADWVFT